MNTCYSDFLAYCLDEKNHVPESCRSIDWNEMLVWAEKQSVVGVIFDGIQKAGNALSIPTDVLMKWIGYANIIENRNKLLNRRCVEVGTYLKTKGFDVCILKGQGIAAMYPNPLLRTPGDIDVWVRTLSDGSRKKDDIKKIIGYVKGKNPLGKANYHHIDYGDFNGVEVEVHYRPTFMNNLIANRRLQQWMQEHEDEQFCNRMSFPNEDGCISVPTWEFNVVFQLSHIYRHVIQRGIGLRQFIDYYYLLVHNEECRMHNWKKTLKYLNLDQFAGAVMWVLSEILGLDERYLIVPVDERRGRFLYEEIMRGGNFGYYTKGRKPKGRIAMNIDRLIQDLRLVRYFPSECLWEPVFRVYHWFWRLRYNCY